MAYNIDTWKTKKLESLQINISEFTKNSDKNYHPDVKYTPIDSQLEVVISFIDSEIKGVMAGNVVWITGINIRGEGSGTFMHEVFEPAFEPGYCTGELEAVLIWEGGDSVTRLKIDSEGFSNEQIDL